MDLAPFVILMAVAVSVFLYRAMRRRQQERDALGVVASEAGWENIVRSPLRAQVTGTWQGCKATIFITQGDDDDGRPAAIHTRLFAATGMQMKLQSGTVETVPARWLLRNPDLKRQVLKTISKNGAVEIERDQINACSDLPDIITHYGDMLALTVVAREQWSVVTGLKEMLSRRAVVTTAARLFS